MYLFRGIGCRFALALLVLVSFARADVTLPAIIGDHMVLQQGVDVPIWGTADVGEQVKVTLNEQHKSATADAGGRWMVHLDALEASNEPVEIKIVGKNEITLKDVLIGEVWLGSGQSNMEFKVANAKDHAAEIKAADHPRIRLFAVARKIATEPVSDTEGSWAVCSPENVGRFSAVAYFFGRDLQHELKVPVGLIHSSVGGTGVMAWTPMPVLDAEKPARPELGAWKRLEAKAVKVHEQWEKSAERARAADRPVPAEPVDANKDRRERNGPARLYNGMIAPIVPFAIRGVVWYQGEHDAGAAYRYRTMLQAMIESWRDAWGRNFTCLIVSLPNFRAIVDHPTESNWAEMREAQAMVAAQPNNGLAVTIDLGEADNIHPINKQPVGHRLMLEALATVYGRDIIASGPVYDFMKIEGGRIRIRFKNAQGLTTKDGQELRGFAVAGKDRKYHWAKATLDGDSVIVESDQVAEPIAVRYAWADNPVCNLCNGAGLPAAPFRTDGWPGVTARRH
jgi:sialate O-acetylesterase